LLYYMVRH